MEYLIAIFFIISVVLVKYIIFKLKFSKRLSHELHPMTIGRKYYEKIDK